MSLFSRKKNVLQQVIQTSWKNDAEREELVAALKDSDLKAIEALPLLWHTDASFRRIGTEAFVKTVNAEALRSLVQQLTDKPSHVRASVARVLPRVNPELMRQVVDEMIAHTNAQNRRMGWEVALSLGGELRHRYLERATREAPHVLRATALRTLLQDRKPTELVDLLVELTSSDEPKVAATAVEALVKIDDVRVVDIMIKCFQGSDATLRELASTYLREAAAREPVKMRKKMMELMSAGEDATRRLSMEILLRSGTAEEVLTEILVFSRELVGWLRTRILETLRTFGDDILRPAVKLLNHEDEEVRTAALVLAESFNDPRLVGPISKLLEDPDWWLRVIACESLGRLKDERALPVLIKALDDSDTRWAAIDALASIGSINALKPLAMLLRSDRQEVRLEVLRAFSKFSDARLLPLLKSVQEKDPSSEVRTRASEVHRDMSVRLEMDAGSVEAGTMAVGASSLKKPIDKLLANVRERGASDIHMTVGEPPFIRLTGGLERMEMSALTAEQTEEAILSIMNPRIRAIFEAQGEVDFCYAIPEVGRYRANAFRQRKGVCAAFRVIPNVPPTFADLRLPGRLTELLDYHQGMIVVSGPAGSGKSTTLGAIVNLINETKPDHVITLEDPIELVHPVKTALVNQREVGTHTESFARALRAALREDPDVIVVGEMRDAETIRMALTAAETGHLVVATLHTTSAVQTVDRMIKAFPPEEQPQVRMALSESLKYVVCQSLIPRNDGKGRVGVYEVLKGTPSIGTLIRDNKTFQIPSMMQIGQSLGMQTVDVALMELYEAGLISAETAWLRAEKQALFEPMCDPGFLSGTSDQPAEEGA